MPPTDLIAGRYRLGPASATGPGNCVSHRGLDVVLDRPVVVRLISGTLGPVLDAGRRAALVTDTRLVRLLDIGTLGDGRGYLVTEAVDGPSLTDLLRGPLHPEQVRAVVGEVASALEVARRRGVHHLALRPDAIALARDGRVVVQGLAVDAALLGRTQGDQDASRADARDLLRLLYVGLTGRWPVQPGDPESSGPVPVPSDADGVFPPVGAVQPGLPSVLTALLRPLTGGRVAPETPGEVAQALEPWGEIKVTEAPPGTPAAVPPAANSASRAAGSVGAAGRLPAPPSAWSPAELDSPVPPPVPGGEVVPVVRPEPVIVVGPADTPAHPMPVVDEPRDGSAPGADGESEAVAGTAGASGDAAGPGTASGGAPGAGGSGGGAGSSSGAGAVGGTAGPRRSGPATDPVPVVTRTEYSARRPRRAGLVTVAIVVVVLVAVVVGVTALFDRGESATPVPSTSAAAGAVSTGAASTSAGTSPGASGSASASSAAPAAPAIASITTYDPVDADGEHAELTGALTDGDPSTQWHTRTYRTAAFGGLKAGVGLVVTLTARAAVSTVILDTPSSGGNIEIRAADSADPATGTLLASGPAVPGTTTFTLATPTALTGLVVWISQLPQATDGFRLEVSRLAVG